jgi:predicted O-linked N-acetylglucosamine transferase (SPINDLY family)
MKIIEDLINKKEYDSAFKYLELNSNSLAEDEYVYSKAVINFYQGNINEANKLFDIFESKFSVKKLNYLSIIYCLVKNELGLHEDVKKFIDNISNQVNDWNLVEEIANFVFEYKEYISIIDKNSKNKNFLSILILLAMKNDNSKEIIRLTKLNIKPYKEIHLKLAEYYYDQKNFTAAISEIKKTLELNFKSYDASLILAGIYLERGEFKNATYLYEKLIKISPEKYYAYHNLIYLLIKTNKLDDAEIKMQYALSKFPLEPQLHIINSDLKRLQNNNFEMLKSLEKAYELKSNIKYLQGKIIHNKLRQCYWDKLEIYSLELSQNQKKISLFEPFQLIGHTDNPRLMQETVNSYSDTFKISIDKYKYPVIEENSKICIAYITSDFFNHATWLLIRDIIKRHDTDKYKIIGIHTGKKFDESTEEASKSFQEFYKIGELSSSDKIKFIRKLNIHIALDLKGFTEEHSHEIFKYRCAPIQVNYLAFPATMGKSYDYIIADKFLINEDNIEYFDEKVIYLPLTYQPSSSSRLFEELDADDLSILNASDGKFVLCNFNAHYKISKDIFSLWCDLINENNNVVFWLIYDNDESVKNLKKFAASKNVCLNKLHFFKKKIISKHLNRIRFAHLFVDTYPCAAHTTANDSIFAGVPIVALPGKAFHTRVSGSLNHSIDLSELNAKDLTDYKNIVCNLIYDYDYYGRIKNHFNNNRHKIFDMNFYTKKMENSFSQIINRYQNHQEMIDINVD